MVNKKLFDNTFFQFDYHKKVVSIYLKVKQNCRPAVGARLVSWNCFPKSVCVCVCLYVFPHPREQTFYLKLESSLYTI